MQLHIFLSLAGLAAAGVLDPLASPVKREAEASPEADPEADPQVLHGHKPVAVSAPQCHSVPELKCVPRQVDRFYIRYNNTISGIPGGEPQEGVSPGVRRDRGHNHH